MKEGGAYVKGTRTIAGSATSLGAALRFAVQRANVPLTSALEAATRVPARVLGLRDAGAIEKGFAADLIVFDALEIEAVMVGGECRVSSIPSVSANA